MVFVRADIVRNASSALGRAVTIATRYAAVRRQTAPGPGQKEVQVGTEVHQVPEVPEPWWLGVVAGDACCINVRSRMTRTRGSPQQRMSALSAALRASRGGWECLSLSHRGSRRRRWPSEYRTWGGTEGRATERWQVQEVLQVGAGGG